MARCARQGSCFRPARRASCSSNCDRVVRPRKRPLVAMITEGGQLASSRHFGGFVFSALPGGGLGRATERNADVFGPSEDMDLMSWVHDVRPGQLAALLEHGRDTEVMREVAVHEPRPHFRGRCNAAASYEYQPLRGARDAFRTRNEAEVREVAVHERRVPGLLLGRLPLALFPQRLLLRRRRRDALSRASRCARSFSRPAATSAAARRREASRRSAALSFFFEVSFCFFCSAWNLCGDQ